MHQKQPPPNVVFCSPDGGGLDGASAGGMRPWGAPDSGEANLPDPTTANNDEVASSAAALRPATLCHTFMFVSFCGATAHPSDAWPRDHFRGSARTKDEGKTFVRAANW